MSSSSTGSYIGWRILAGNFICSMLAVAGTVHVFGLFVIPVSEAFNLSRANTNNGLILVMLGMAVWSPLVGKLVDRYPARLIMTFGAFSYCLGYLFISSSTSLWQIAIAIAGPVSLSVVCAGSLAANTVTTRWFQRNRGKALGILAVSTSAGGFLLTPVFAYLIAQYGWQGALGITAIAIPCCLMLAIVFLVRDRPSEEFIASSAEFSRYEPSERDNSQEAAGEEQSWLFSELLRLPNFWLLSVGAGLLLACDSALMATKVPYLVDGGISLARAAVFASCTTASAIAGKVIAGILADKIDPRNLFGIVVGCHLVMLATLVAMPNYWLLLVIASVFGIAVGGVYPVWLSLTARAFGAKTYGTVIGAMAIIMQPLAIVAIRFIGEVHDYAGGYATGYIFFAGIAVLSYLFISRVKLLAQ